MKTESIKKKDISRDWHLIDATDKTLGRLSSKVATILRGKNKVNYSPNIDMSDFVVIINSDKIKTILNFEPKYTIEDAVKELCDAFKNNNLPNSFDDENYFNVKKMLKLNVS